MLTAKEARTLAGTGYDKKTAELHQMIRERSMDGFCWLEIETSHFPEGVLKDLTDHGFTVQKVTKQNFTLIKW